MMHRFKEVNPARRFPYGYRVTTSPPVMNHYRGDRPPKVRLTTSGGSPLHGVDGR